jgi:hypothetical protein
MHLHARSSQILLVHHVSSRQVTLPFPYGCILSVAYFNVEIGKRTPECEISLPGPVTIHLAPSKYAGWCYLQLPVGPRRYDCTCYEKQSAGYCQHVHDLETPLVAAEAM